MVSQAPGKLRLELDLRRVRPAILLLGIIGSNSTVKIETALLTIPLRPLLREIEAAVLFFRFGFERTSVHSPPLSLAQFRS